MGNLIVSVFGAATSLLTAYLLFLIEKQTGYALYSFTVVFVIPIGAMGAGALAAVGYYLGALLCNQRPSGFLFLNMVGVSSLTYFFIHYLAYAEGVIDGQPIREFISFQEYLDIVIRTTSLQVGTRIKLDMAETGELGRWGYVYAGLQIAGFALGGFCVYGYLLMLPYCRSCSQYYSKVLKQNRYTADESAFALLPGTLDHLLATKRLDQAVVAHASTGHPSSGHGRRLLSTLEVKVCRRCECRWAKFTAFQEGKNGWTEISEWEFEHFLGPATKEPDLGAEEIIQLKRV